MPFFIAVGSWTFFRYFGVLLFVLMIRVSWFAFMLRSFSFTPGSSARIIRWFCSSKMSRRGCLSFVKLGMCGNNVARGCVFFDLPDVLLT